MTIEYRSQPGHIQNFIEKNGARFVGWDLDGTLANTERLHRALCRSALQEISGGVISEREFGSPRYRSAFGLPGGETSLHLAKTLKENNPGGFQHALRFALSRELVGDSCETVAQALTQLRDETFAFYIKNATLRRADENAGTRHLVLSPPLREVDERSARRWETLKDVRVHTYPYVLEVLATFERHGLTQGICTSSGKCFVHPLIRALGLTSYFESIVTADCVPSGQHKPEPTPWHILRARLEGAEPCHRNYEPITDMLFIENSAGGGFSSIRAGQSPTFVIADNIAATVGKMQAKMRATKGNPDYVVHGRAIFIDSLGALVAPSRSSCDL
jgi:hypothetical protein